MGRRSKFFFSLILLAGISFSTLRYYIASQVFVPKAFKDGMVNLIVEEKAIRMPFFYRCYNPGVVQEGDEYTLVARCDRMGLLHSIEKKLGWFRRTYFVQTKLDKEFERVGPVELVRVAPGESYRAVSPNDPRLFSYRNRTYMLFNDHYLVDGKREGDRAMYLAELTKNEKGPYIKNVCRLIFDEAENFYKHDLVTYRCEKNWTPLVRDDDLYLVYLLDPLVVLSVDVETGKCSQIADKEPTILSSFGTPRGGTPLIPSIDGYISLYHVKSPREKKMLGPFETKGNGGYYFSAYLLSKEFPFSVEKKMNKLITGSSLYKGRKKVEYPTALIDLGDRFAVFWGHEDASIRMGTIYKEAILKELE